MYKFLSVLSVVFAVSTAAMACTSGGMYCTSNDICCSGTCLREPGASSGICKSVEQRKKECGPGAENGECILGHCKTGICVLRCFSDGDCGQGKCGLVDGPGMSGICTFPRCLEKEHCKASSARCDPRTWSCNSSDQSCNRTTDCNEDPFVQTHLCVPQWGEDSQKKCKECFSGECNPSGLECDTVLDCGSDPKYPSYKCVPQYPDDMPFNPTVCKPCEGEEDPECKPADSLSSSDQVLLVQGGFGL